MHTSRFRTTRTERKCVQVCRNRFWIFHLVWLPGFRVSWALPKLLLICWPTLHTGCATCAWSDFDFRVKLCLLVTTTFNPPRVCGGAESVIIEKQYKSLRYPTTRLNRPHPQAKLWAPCIGSAFTRVTMAKFCKPTLSGDDHKFIYLLAYFRRGGSKFSTDASARVHVWNKIVRVWLGHTHSEYTNNNLHKDSRDYLL